MERGGERGEQEGVKWRGEGREGSWGERVWVKRKGGVCKDT